MQKLFSYFDFLLEKTAAKTMRLHYSNKFRSLLEKMQPHSDFAKLLLAAEDSNQISDIYTLIDVTDKNDMISFIQVNRILRANPDTQKYTDDEVYFLNRKITNDETNDFWKTGRTEMAIGKWLRRVVVELYKSPSSLTDSSLEKFVNLYKSTFDGINIKADRFQLVEGEEIRKWYLETNYETIRGQLGNSCMKYQRCQNYLDIYVKNPEVCKLLIMKSEKEPDKIVGRALVWKLYKEKSKEISDYYMDRVYTISDSDSILFDNWADEKNMSQYRKSYKTKYVKLDNGDFNKYPYMDTFICYNDESLLLTNDEDKWPGQGYIKIDNTDGSYTPGDAIWSDWHEEYILRDEAVYCEDIRDYLRETDAIYLEYKDTFVSPGARTVHSEYFDANYYEDDTVRSEIMEDWLYAKSKDVIEIQLNHYGDTDYCIKSRTDIYIKVGDEYYSTKNYIKDPYSDEYHFVDEKETKDSPMSWGDNLYHKILEDIIPKNMQDLRHPELAIFVRQQISDMIKSGDFDKDSVKKEISENEIFKKRIRGLYWGFHKSDLPEAEDLIPIISSFKLYEPWTSPGRTSSTKLSYGYQQAVSMITDEDLKNKYNSYRDTSFLRTVATLASSIKSESFGKEIYKRLVFLSL